MNRHALKRWWILSVKCSWWNFRGNVRLAWELCVVNWNKQPRICGYCPRCEYFAQETEIDVDSMSEDQVVLVLK